MRCKSIVRTRVLSLDSISEEEAVVLRTLLNLREEGVRKKLDCDRLYWEDEGLSEDDAVEIGCDICKKIMELVDKK